MVYDIFGQDVADYSSGMLERENIYRGGQLLATQEFNNRVNVALADNGGTAVASSTYGTNVAANANNGDRKGTNGLVWMDSSLSSFPDWIEVDFDGSKTINEIDVVTRQDDLNNPVEPSLSQTFSLYGITAFDVQYWDGNAWVTVSNGSVTGNNKVWRQFSFASVTTSKVRVAVNAGADNAYSRVVEVEAWGSQTAGPIKYVLSDIQGSTRAVMSNNGSSSAIIARHDYLPFGEEIGAGLGLRTTSQSYGATDTNRQKYGLTERDDATGLDHTWWRKYENLSGRWTSPDPYNGSASIADPQSFHRYNYTQNDPVNFVDPTGLEDDPGPPPDCGPGTVAERDGQGHWQCVGVGSFTVNVYSDPFWDQFSAAYSREIDLSWIFVLPQNPAPPSLPDAIKLAKQLLADPKGPCAALFKKRNGLSTLTELEKKNKIKIADTKVKLFGGPERLLSSMPGVGGVTTSKGIFIYTAGRIALGNPNPTGPFGKLTPLEAFAAAIIHEDAHKTGDFPYEANPEDSYFHSADVVDACFGG